VLPELAAIGSFVILLWVSLFVALDREYRTTVATAEQSGANLARALEETTRRTVRQIDQVLLSARAFYVTQGDRFDFAEWASTQATPDNMTAAIGMADAAGRVFAATLPIPSGARIDDRPHFKAHIDPARDELYISRPVTGRLSGQTAVQFSRRLLSPSGDFAGVAVLSLATHELTQLYRSLDLGEGFVSLLLGDGTVLSPAPPNPIQLGQRMTDDPALARMLTERRGTLRINGSDGQLDQIVSFRRLKDYQLIVMVSLDADSVFRQYWSLRARMIVGAAIATIAICGIGFLWVRQKRRSNASRRALDVTLETIGQGILMVDSRGGVPVINSRARDLLALPDASPEAIHRLAGQRAMDLARQHDHQAAGQRSDDTTGSGVRFDVAREDGTVIEVRSHALADGGFVHSYTDVTEQRLADARVRYLAHHDTLTGLANRVQLRQRIPEYLPKSADPQQLTAFMLIDLDGFKGINDTMGHDVGDELLIEVARRLQSLVREQDFVARLGGDEFVVLQPGLSRVDAAAALAQRLLCKLAEPVQIAGQQVRVGASIGIAFHPNDGQDGDTLYKHADIALYSAKAAGRGTVRFFDAQMTWAVNENRLLESGLRWAMDNEALDVHFQPKFACTSLAIVGFEALVRWQHPTRGSISPQTFIRVAEECGLIKRLGLWVIERTCTIAAAWQSRQPMAVNVSLLQLHDGDLVGDIAAILKRTGFPADLLEIEVTESVMADDNRAVLDTLHGLKAMGVRIALDDFGTGYSSLSYLRRFSFDRIKIDKSFVQGQAHDQGVRVILEAILGMCHKLGLPVVGEGVETRQQLMMLRHCGCNEVQGYLLGRPLPADAVEEFLERNRRELADDSGLAAAAKEYELAL